MKYQIIKFTDERPGQTPIKGYIEIKKANDLEVLKKGTLPLIYLLKNEDLTQLKKIENALIERSKKNRHKGLSKYLLNLKSDRIPAINSNISANQVLRSIRSLLVNAQKKGEQKCYFVGIEERVFELHWKKAREDMRDMVIQNMTDYQEVELLGKDPQEQVLHEIMQKVDVEPSLYKKFIGTSREVQYVRVLIMLAAGNLEPVLIVGDTGTGKEVVARAIHNNTESRKYKPFIPVNCGGIPSNLLESELFGHVKGSFTDADEKKGLWEVAENGTIFLDEIGDLPLYHQVKILRALEEKKIRRVGGLEDIKVNARVIAATNQDLLSMVQNKRFREDLYYRLHGFFISTPALKSHPEDIPAIAEYLWQAIVEDSNKHLPSSILNELETRSWPGNVRELKWILHRLFTFFPDIKLEPRHLAFVINQDNRREPIKVDSRPKDGPSKSDSGYSIYRDDCYNRLRKVDQIIHAIEFKIAPYLKNQEIEAKAISEITESVQCSLSELELLCRESLLFHSENIYSAVIRLKENIDYFYDLIQQDAEKARQYLKETLQPEFRPVMLLLFKEVEHILRLDRG